MHGGKDPLLEELLRLDSKELRTVISDLLHGDLPALEHLPTRAPDPITSVLSVIAYPESKALFSKIGTIVLRSLVDWNPAFDTLHMLDRVLLLVGKLQVTRAMPQLISLAKRKFFLQAANDLEHFDAAYSQLLSTIIGMPHMHGFQRELLGILKENLTDPLICGYAYRWLCASRDLYSLEYLPALAMTRCAEDQVVTGFIINDFLRKFTYDFVGENIATLLEAILPYRATHPDFPVYCLTVLARAGLVIFSDYEAATAHVVIYYDKSQLPNSGELSRRQFSRIELPEHHRWFFDFPVLAESLLLDCSSKRYDVEELRSAYFRETIALAGLALPTAVRTPSHTDSYSVGAEMQFELAAQAFKSLPFQTRSTGEA